MTSACAAWLASASGAPSPAARAGGRQAGWPSGASRPRRWSSRRHGFETFRAGTPGNLGREPEAYTAWTRVDDGRESASEEHATAAVRTAFLEWWCATPGPRFAWVAFHAAQQPLHAPPAAELPAGHPAPETDRQRFEAAVVALDRTIGLVLDELDLARTLVVFVSDNGTPPLAAAPEQRPAHLKSTTYEESVNVPLILAGPGVAAGARTDALVHLVDLCATLAAYTGAELPAGADEDSLSFAPSLRDPALPGERTHLLLEFFEAEPGRPPSEDDLAVRSRTHKLRRFLGLRGTREQLFDLARDPREEHPLDLSEPANRALRDELATWLEALPARASR
jgi:arylsulfatase A-like enzyme